MYIFSSEMELKKTSVFFGCDKRDICWGVLALYAILKCDKLARSKQNTIE